MIDSGSRSQVRPLESFKRSRFGLLAIASFIQHRASCPRRGLGRSRFAADASRVRSKRYTYCRSMLRLTRLLVLLLLQRFFDFCFRFVDLFLYHSESVAT